MLCIWLAQIGAPALTEPTVRKTLWMRAPQARSCCRRKTSHCLIYLAWICSFVEFFNCDAISGSDAENEAEVMASSLTQPTSIMPILPKASCLSSNQARHLGSWLQEAGLVTHSSMGFSGFTNAVQLTMKLYLHTNGTHQLELLPSLAMTSLAAVQESSWPPHYKMDAQRTMEAIQQQFGSQVGIFRQMTACKFLLAYLFAGQSRSFPW